MGFETVVVEFDGRKIEGNICKAAPEAQRGSYF